MGRIQACLLHDPQSISVLPADPRLPYLEQPLPDPEPNLGYPIQQRHGFFALPTELRREILIEAFGRRTIHVDLRLRATQDGGCRTPERRLPRHGGYPPLMTREQSLETQKQRQRGEESWQWYSCICHRVAPPGESSLWVQEPFWDSCLQGVASCCDAWPGEFPQKCKVGAMGFLRSCKQAYIEAIDVLYSTNEIFIESPELIHTMLRQSRPDSDRLLGPGLHWISSLTLKWTFTLFSQEGSMEEKAERSRFNECIQLLPRTFPLLRKLYLAFGDGLYSRNASPQSYASEINEALLQPLYTLTDKTEISECIVALPSNIFDAIRARAPITPYNNAKLSSEEGVWNLKIRYPWSEDKRSQDGKRGLWIKYGGESSLLFRPDGTSFSLSCSTECHQTGDLLAAWV